MERKIKFYGNYFEEFYISQSQKVKDKIDYVLDIIKHIDHVPVEFLKYLAGTDALYEIKIKTSFKNIRIFCFLTREIW